ncbi:hypothetical protein ALC60_02726 [Trachymyrmex zeteki]|uniref:Uncharacterized protein n=1 Tax=Mycetomoellerius zeteki TaxID=64791 RepID=A0A151XD54_9HYME|nr:hypothetical protein ALC60_02726 [Trachymyrmex zeteki]
MNSACAVIYLPLELRDFLCHETDPLDHLPALAWPRQEQPCPIAGDFCMNGGTCLFFETVGEPACNPSLKFDFNAISEISMSLLESTREIELTFLVTPLCAATDELAVSGVERSFTKCLLSIARKVEVLDSRRKTRSLGRGSSIFSRYTRERSSRFSWTLLSISFYVLLIPLSPPNSYARYLFQQ